ncbi:LamB/YcsF family protein [Variovorax sp. CY25R-8]|uniref:LamB/YcsF family protein n=1 Tax=Variovorax sp. CY25R-8 TaxID=2855501 RepID=UPI0021BA4832|nr:5-oxoprolinase subunit PxpA [Variovorax sp. CY25R-8]MCT8179215.1 LamB/YcsF family protein [Variovorax sp. CY25R-8]
MDSSIPTSPPRSIDLNSDMGEGFGAYRMGDDDAILEVVSSANVACGFHAGDPDVMARTFALAKIRQVAVGAHPGYQDLAGFGRRGIACSPAEIERLVAYQVGAAQGLAAYSGHRLTHVKAHGALGNLTQTDAEVAAAVSRAIRAVDPSLVCLVIARGHQERIARELGLQVRSEIFADRGYTEDGHLVSRKIPGAVLHDAQEAAARVLRMVRANAIETVSGRLLPTAIDSICVHSDTPSAVAMARAVRQALESAGIAIRSFA